MRTSSRDAKSAIKIAVSERGPHRGTREKRDPHRLTQTSLEFAEMCNYNEIGSKRVRSWIRIQLRKLTGSKAVKGGPEARGTREQKGDPLRGQRGSEKGVHKGK